MVLSPAVSLGLVEIQPAHTTVGAPLVGALVFAALVGPSCPSLEQRMAFLAPLRVTSRIEGLCLQRNAGERHPEPDCRPSGPVELRNTSQVFSRTWHWDHPMLRRIFTGEMG